MEPIWYIMFKNSAVVVFGTSRITDSQINSKAVCSKEQFSLVRKPVFGVSDLVRHKPGCTTTEDGLRLEISYIRSRGIVLYV